MRTFTPWYILVLFITACGHTSKHNSVEPVYRDAIVTDPEIEVMEKTFDRDFTGLVPKYYAGDSNKLDYLLVVSNGELKARYFFDRNQHVQEENHYDCAAMHGTQKRFFTNGKVKEILEMDHGLRHGRHIRYNENGELMASENWKEGKPAGPIKVYDSLGKFSHYAGREKYDSLFLR